MELSIYVLFRFEHEHEQDLDHFQTRSNWTRRQNQTSTPPPSRTGYRQMSTRMDSTARRKRTKQLKLPEPLPVEPWSSSWSLSFWSFVQSKLNLKTSILLSKFVVFPQLTSRQSKLEIGFFVLSFWHVNYELTCALKCVNLWVNWPYSQSKPHLKCRLISESTRPSDWQVVNAAGADTNLFCVNN